MTKVITETSGAESSLLMRDAKQANAVWEDKRREYITDTSHIFKLPSNGRTVSSHENPLAEDPEKAQRDHQDWFQII